ncbi:MAG TPA: lamin tail domain-containing protein, partial [Saprospiraceae bacterium]|nr:lamin tail domain-containing protein [Saprospiraceae bacterium]
MPDSLIYPDEFVILCDPDFIPDLSSYGRIIGVANMPSLTNTGAYLAIKNLNGDILHDLTYDGSWYVDPNKSDGGWSLEMKNPNRACSEGANWAASGSLSGGTPGHINSNWDISPDTDGPAFVSIYIPDTHSIILHFDEKLDALLTLTENDFVFDPPLGSLTLDPFDPSSIILVFDSILQPGITYRLFPIDAYDCLGNIKHQSDTIKFGLIEDAQPGDLLINEILFNPQSGGSRFIEVINPTGKYINLNTLAIGRLKGTITNIYPTGIQEVLGPGEIAAFTPDRQDILSRFTVPKPGKLYDASLPSWDSDSDNASLLVNGEVIDSFTYSSDWHHPVIADQNGVSLERSSVTAATTLASNWHSASSLSGYATPTGENSQRI